MKTAGDVEDQALRRIGRHHWCIAVTSLGKPVEQLGVSAQVGIKDNESGYPRPCIRKRQTGCETKPQRDAVDCRQPHTSALFLNQRKRDVIRLRVFGWTDALYPLRGKERQVHCEILTQSFLYHGSTPDGLRTRQCRRDDEAR